MRTKANINKLWHKIKLRARNNYGKWNSVLEVYQFINQAIEGIVDKEEIKKELMHSEERHSLAKKMIHEMLQERYY